MQGDKATEDIKLIKNIAKVLSAGGPVAEKLREGIRAWLPWRQAQSGEQLVDFFQTSPLREEDRHIFEGLPERSIGRLVDLKGVASFQF